MRTIPSFEEWLRKIDRKSETEDFHYGYHTARTIGITALAKRDAEIAALKATVEDYRIQACQPDNCRKNDEIARLNRALERLAERVGIYCPKDECCEEYRKDAKACIPCMVKWALKEGGNGSVA